eukprot:SAG31_NODE_3149_length_4618_cov_1.653242_2_plen_217_part_00
MHYFSAEQVRRALEIIPECGHVEACTTMFGRIKDLEATDWQRWLSHDDETRLWHRLGAANCLNPYLPDRTGERMYELNLGDHDDQMVGMVLVQLEKEEDGENIPIRTNGLDGIPIDEASKSNWARGQLPQHGRFHCEYITGEGTIKVRARVKMAQRLLMPSTSAWQVILSRKPTGLSAKERENAEKHFPLDADSKLELDIDGINRKPKQSTRGCFV